jgi:hypothetical protein
MRAEEVSEIAMVRSCSETLAGPPANVPDRSANACIVLSTRSPQADVGLGIGPSVPRVLKQEDIGHQPLQFHDGMTDIVSPTHSRSE